jgi:hypothetical protein
MTDNADCFDISLGRQFHSLIPPRQERHIDRRIIRKHRPHAPIASANKGRGLREP